LVVFHWFSDCAQMARQLGLFWEGHNRNYRSSPERRGFGTAFGPKFSVAHFRGQHVPEAQSRYDVMTTHNHREYLNGNTETDNSLAWHGQSAERFSFVTILREKLELWPRAEINC
jgi:hypothetical protein